MVVTNNVLDRTQTIGGVNFEYKMAKDDLEAAEKALAGNQDGTLTIGLTEDVRRAQAQYDFFAAQKENVETRWPQATWWLTALWATIRLA